MDRVVDNYKRLEEMLPNELRGPDRAQMFKDVLGVYSMYADGGDALYREYGEVLDIYGAQRNELDFIGAMYVVLRRDGEDDIAYRNRIISTVIERKTGSNLPDLQEAIDSITVSGKLYLLENYDGKPCNVYLTGTADDETIARALELIKRFLPAGVMAIIPIVSFEIWQHIKDQFTTWGSLGDEGYIW